MTNWATTSYCIEGDKEDLNKIYDVLTSLSTENDPYNGSTSDWEGHIIMALGAKEEDLKGRSIRGFILDYGMFGDTLNIEAQEAWDRTEFSEMLSELMPELSIYYRVEEPCMEIYYTNDAHGEYFPERFYLYSCVDGNMQSDYFTNKEDLYDYIGKLLGRGDINDEMIERWNEKNVDKGDFIYIYEFEIG